MERVCLDDNEINEHYDDYSFHKLDKNVIKLIIEEYSQNVAKFYKTLITWEEERWIFWITLWDFKLKKKKKNEKIYKHLWQRYSEFSWKKLKKKQWWFWWDRPYNIEEWDFAKSREYEYQIFDLIRIYREFDEEKDVLLYYWY